MFWFGAALSAASQIYGGYKAGKARGEQARASAVNAIFAKAGAARKAERARKVGKSYISEQRAKLAASGVSLDSGSPMLVMAETAAEVERAAYDIIQEGEYAAYQDNLQSDYYKKAGDAARVTGIMGGMSTLLAAYGEKKTLNPPAEGASSVPSPGYKFKPVKLDYNRYRLG